MTASTARFSARLEEGVLSHVISYLWRQRLRLILDTDVVVAALRSDRGASRQLLYATLDRRFELLASVPLIIEYEAVLTRPEHLEASGLTARQVNEVLDALVQVSIPVPLRFLWRPQLKDPADEMVLETAVNGAADWLVTFNLRHLADAARQFGIRVKRPSDAWREIRRDEKK
jgi:putative PIN family toxin of toxin-antitoxin system